MKTPAQLMPLQVQHQPGTFSTPGYNPSQKGHKYTLCQSPAFFIKKMPKTDTLDALDDAMTTILTTNLDN